MSRGLRPWEAADEAEPSARQSLVTRASARAARTLPKLHDQEPDISDAAYELLVGEGGPLLLALASASPDVRGQAQARLRALAHRYRTLVAAELKRG